MVDGGSRVWAWLETAVYTHGHHDSRPALPPFAHRREPAAYLLPQLQPDMRVLDVGCGPGTITA
ncbi:hypothetical protein ACU686_10815 [Yinghuangia aomiensis]